MSKKLPGKVVPKRLFPKLMSFLTPVLGVVFWTLAKVQKTSFLDIS